MKTTSNNGVLELQILGKGNYELRYIERYLLHYREQFPREVEEWHNILYPVMKRALQNEQKTEYMYR